MARRNEGPSEMKKEADEIIHIREKLTGVLKDAVAKGLLSDVVYYCDTCHKIFCVDYGAEHSVACDGLAHKLDFRGAK